MPRSKCASGCSTGRSSTTQKAGQCCECDETGVTIAQHAACLNGVLLSEEHEHGADALTHIANASSAAPVALALVIAPRRSPRRARARARARATSITLIIALVVAFVIASVLAFVIALIVALVIALVVTFVLAFVIAFVVTRPGRPPCKREYSEYGSGPESTCLASLARPFRSLSASWPAVQQRRSTSTVSTASTA